MARLTTLDLREMKSRGEKIAMLTAYDYPTAKLVSQAGTRVLLVGDSLGMVVLGYETTLPVTLEVMIHHARAVVRGAPEALVVVDMPFMSYQVNADEAVRNAGRVLQETGAQAVKLEGGASVAPVVRRMVEAGIPVMGHVGLTPQSVNVLGGYRVQGRTPAQAVKLMNDAAAVEEAGAFAIVLETVPAPIAKRVSEQLSIPTIGIGAGPFCDGQVQVVHDMLGICDEFKPRHARRYADLAGVIRGAVAQYVHDVQGGAMPGPDESFGLRKMLEQSGGEAPEDAIPYTPPVPHGQ